jgi:SAM-dependent methyltransferase
LSRVAKLLRPGGTARNWLRRRKLALLMRIGRRIGGDLMAEMMCNVPEFAEYMEQFQNRAPQGHVVDRSVTQYDVREWRTELAARLHGHGIELGALHRPMPTHEGITVTYVDRADSDTLKREYPLLAEAIVPVGIIDDAETLATITDGRYDFLVAAHVIEHMRDPIGALVHWLRVVRDGGHVYLVVPDKRTTFDRKRVRTTLAHMVLDHQRPSKERDFEHYVDYALFVHDKSDDESLDEAQRLFDADFSIHYHVFLPQDVVRLAEWIDGHVTPVRIVAGPVASPGSDEFHLLLQKGAQA